MCAMKCAFIVNLAKNNVNLLNLDVGVNLGLDLDVVEFEHQHYIFSYTIIDLVLKYILLLYGGFVQGA